jgi:hypothetical protein
MLSVNIPTVRWKCKRYYVSSVMNSFWIDDTIDESDRMHQHKFAENCQKCNPCHKITMIKTFMLLDANQNPKRFCRGVIFVRSVGNGTQVVQSVQGRAERHWLTWGGTLQLRDFRLCPNSGDLLGSSFGSRDCRKALEGALISEKVDLPQQTLGSTPVQKSTTLGAGYFVT